MWNVWLHNICLQIKFSQNVRLQIKLSQNVHIPPLYNCIYNMAIFRGMKMKLC